MQWNKINVKHILDYKTTSKKIFENERVDPEYYQPKFENLINHLKKIGSMKLGDFCPMPNRDNAKKETKQKLQEAKELVEKEIEKLLKNKVKIWQRNYYEHIIRNETELYKIRE